MSVRVHLYRKYSSLFEKVFFARLDQDIKISSGDTIPDPADFEILVHPTPKKAWIEASPNLHAIVIPWAGIPKNTREIMTAYPHISMHNLHHNSFNTAEFGLTLLLAAAKFLIPMDQTLRNNDWSPRYQPSQAILLRGKKALILGYGEIGQALGSYCLGLGMKVIATKRHPDHCSSDPDIQLFSPDKLHSLLPEAEVLFIALPLTEETEDLVGKKEINLMPKGSILINIGRGPIVNQYALYDSLVSEHLRAAGSDVWYNYPKSEASRQSTPPAEVPFGRLDNFVLSPHRGGMVEDVEKQRAKALADLLNAANRNLPIPNKVDLEMGY
ncbi:MAG: NAD(P)-dependent oxidoreductase [Chloroflexota bacterium]|nr:NAD(P)-dependent oxidoreductase [Chloroflexota bacterium]